VEEDFGQVGVDFFRGGYVRGEETKEGAFVFLVADDDGDFGVLSCFEEDVRRLRESFSVGTRQVGEVNCEVG
jgi:hypothetical protein